MSESPKLLLVGCGKMGGALLLGWLTQGVDPTAICVVDPGLAAAGQAPFSDLGVAVHADEHGVPTGFTPDVIMMAVKPQMMDDVAPLYRRFLGTNTVVLSIAAGKTIDYFERQFDRHTAIVRAMPNTPAAVGRGVTAALCNANVSSDQRQLCDQLLSAVGQVVWLTEEAQMDIVTALSGGGPAYVFLLTEALAAAGESAGLSPDLAMTLARATVSGAGELMAQDRQTPAQLRINVTSPKGTTEAALAVLMAEDGLMPLMQRAVQAATARSRELAG